MAVIEVCDICDKKVDMSDGITNKCSDNKGFSFICGDAVRHERNYDVRGTFESMISPIKEIPMPEQVML